MSDVRIYNTADGGEVDITNGVPFVDDGLESAVFLSLFGGNEDDGGLSGDDAVQWWGNLSERVAERRYRSETQALVRSLPVVPASLRRIEDAVAQDLAWMVSSLAAKVGAKATIPALNRIDLQVEVDIDGKKLPFTFSVIRT